MSNVESIAKLPRVSITSSNAERAKEIVTKMGAKHLSQMAESGLYSLDIDNKYYSAQLLLCTNENLPSDPSKFEALIFHCDLNTENCLKQFDEQVMPIISNTDAEILLLVCDSISNSSLREKTVEWCVTKKFELIELEQQADVMDFEDDHSKYGIDRIVEVLEAHVWPNASFKSAETKKHTQNAQKEVAEVGEQLENIDLSSPQEVVDQLEFKDVLENIMDTNEVDFGALFGQLQVMKEHAQLLPHMQRRVAAEQLVTAFWKAIGEDPSEIESDDEP
ncbi:hypothetical protein TKK_0006607 [Trichogramma kaykai]|uniref:Alpha-and gamma-adaptin-binding protein p34 n=1 Tax=Trichogramma kaykai TaxID=54128 RepID=A0ABD2XBR6_9HYME